MFYFYTPWKRVQSVQGDIALILNVISEKVNVFA